MKEETKLLIVTILLVLWTSMFYIITDDPARQYPIQVKEIR